MHFQASCEASHHLASKSEADGLVLFMRPNPTIPEWFQAEEPELTETLSKLIDAKEIHGQKGNVVVLHALDRPYQRIITCGLGDNPEPMGLMNRFADLTRDLRKKGMERFSVILPDYLYPETPPEDLARLLAGAGTIACYKYHHFMGKEPEPRSFHGEFITKVKEQVAPVDEMAKRGVSLGEAVVLSRDLCNMPGNHATPEYLAQRAEELVQASEGVLKATILRPPELEAEGMNLLRAVARGSAIPPAVICLDYDGDPTTEDRIAIVGKSVTFDAGGISIKPAKSMMMMKRDKMGGTNTLALASYVARWRPRLNCSFVIAAAENMPDGQAYRPGDCYQAMNGKWVEIISTDAEGRLVMADAITWVQKYRKPSVLIDMATLTGGAQMALGGGMIAGFSNTEPLWDKVQRASLRSQEMVWRLPLFQPYKKGVRSYFAETKNSSTTPPSTIKAALFLEEWIDPGVQWAHLDIAASMSQNRPSGIFTRGATGMGLVLVSDVLDLFEKEGFSAETEEGVSGNP